MISLTALTLPVFLSAVIVFIISSIIHMVLGYHGSDFGKVPREEDVMAALRPFEVPPGDYVIPHASSSKEMGSPEFLEKTSKGPVAFLTVIPNGPPSMSTSLILWFLYCIVVSVFSGYLGSRTLQPGVDYLRVFQIVGCAAFMGYGLALLQNAIWYKRNWVATLKSVFDALIYGLFTGGTFGWLWPAA